MEQVVKKVEKNESSQEVIDHAPELVEVSVISELIKGAVAPFSESQKIAAQETTKQTKIIAGTKLKMFWGVCFLVTCILVLAGFALYMDKDSVTEKIIIAIVSFLGGLGIGKQASGNKT